MQTSQTAKNTIAVSELTRRREPRLPCNPTIVSAHVDGYDESVAARVVEVSKAGLQLHTEELLPVGTLVTIDMGGMLVMGHVRHCDERADKAYTVGVMMADVKERR
jgi:hypothetical protein